MAQAKQRVASLLVLLLVSCLMNSCAAVDFFKGSAGKKSESGPEAVQTDAEPPQDQAALVESLETKIDVLETKVSSLENQLAEQKKIIYTVEYSDPAKLYQKARNLMLENDTDNAADLFATFAKQHPEHSLADNALYWLGECHYTKGRYAQSVEVFKELVRRYPKAEKVPDALLKTGYAYLSMDDVDRANHFLTQVIKKYPFSPAAEKAQKKLSAFK